MLANLPNMFHAGACLHMVKQGVSEVERIQVQPGLSTWGSGCNSAWGLKARQSSVVGSFAERTSSPVCFRPEMCFGGIDELVARIKADVGTAKALLDLPEHQLCRAHEVFVRGEQAGLTGM